MNVRTITLVVFISTFALIVSTNTVAAQGRGRMGPSFSRLISMPEVQTELKLQSDLLEKVKAFAEESQAKMREERQMIADQGLEPAEMRAEMTALNDQFQAKDAEALGKILSAEQMTRLKQLMVQQQGFNAITRKEVADAIGLKEEDREKLKATVDIINQETMAKMQEIGQGGDREQAQKIMDESRKQVEATVMSALSDEQKKKFEELKGAAFKFPEPQARGGGRRDF